MVYNGKSGWFGGTFRKSMYIYIYTIIYGYLWIATADGACHSPSLAGLPSSCSRSITCPCGPVAEVEPWKTCCNKLEQGKTGKNPSIFDNYKFNKWRYGDLANWINTDQQWSMQFLGVLIHFAIDQHQGECKEKQKTAGLPMPAATISHTQIVGNDVRQMCIGTYTAGFCGHDPLVGIPSVVRRSRKRV